MIQRKRGKRSTSPHEAVPVEEQETAITRYRNERYWNISTSDLTLQTKVERAGYMALDDKRTAPYKVYKVPRKAISFRKERRAKPGPSHQN